MLTLLCMVAPYFYLLMWAAEISFVICIIALIFFSASLSTRNTCGSLYTG